MVKFHSLLILIAVGLSSVGLPACASHPKALPYEDAEHFKSFPRSKQTIGAIKLWTRKSPGLLTDLNISKDGSTVLVATVPDRDSVEVGANHSKNFASIYSREGVSIAKIEMPAQIKSQSISDDGNLSLVATYDDQIRAYDRTGKEIWAREAICKPLILSAIKKILCFHDDDAEPELAFETFDWDGKKEVSFPVTDDSLMVKIAQNGRYFVIGLNHGKVLLFDSSFKPIWKKTVGGELTDLAISSPSIAEGKKEQPVVAALFNSKKLSRKKIPEGQKITIFSSEQSHSETMGVSARLDQIEFSPDAQALYGYGNDSDGQLLTRVGHKGDELSWKRDDPKPAEYSSQLMATKDWVWVGFEDMTATTRHSHVLGFDHDGGLKTNILVPADEGSYLYTYAFAPTAKVIAIGSDDGALSLFEIK